MVWTGVLRAVLLLFLLSSGIWDVQCQDDVDLKALEYIVSVINIHANRAPEESQPPSASVPRARSASVSASGPAVVPRPRLASVQSSRPASVPASESASGPASQSASQPSARSASVPASQSASLPSARSASVPASRSASLPSAQSGSVPRPRSGSVPSARSAAGPASRSASLPSARSAFVPASRSASVPSARSAPVPAPQLVPRSGHIEDVQYALTIRIAKHQCLSDFDKKGLEPLKKEVNEIQKILKNKHMFYNGKMVVAARPGKRQHSEYRLLIDQNEGKAINELLQKKEKHDDDCVIFYTYNSPCCDICLNEEKDLKCIYDYLKVLTSLGPRAFVFSKLYRKDQDKDKQRKAFEKLAKQIPLYQCDNNNKCWSCEKNNHFCVPDDDQASDLIG